MRHRRPGPRLWMGRGEWLDECLQLLGWAADNRRPYTTDGFADGRIDWTHDADPRTATYLDRLE